MTTRDEWRQRPSPRGNLGKPDKRDVPVYIYALAEPDTGKVRYVGRSSKPANRATSHRTHGSYRMQVWLRQLAEKQLKPTIVILQTVQPGEDADAAERHWIAVHDSPDTLNKRGTSNRKTPQLRADRELLKEAVRLGVYVGSNIRAL